MLYLWVRQKQRETQKQSLTVSLFSPSGTYKGPPAFFSLYASAAEAKEPLQITLQAHALDSPVLVEKEKKKKNLSLSFLDFPFLESPMVDREESETDCSRTESHDHRVGDRRGLWMGKREEREIKRKRKS